jgi:hypothetical protein
VNTLPTRPQKQCRHVEVYRREVVSEGRVTSLLAAEIHAPSPPGSPAHVATQMAAHYFGTLASSCGGLVVASATEAGGSDDAASCGFVLHPAATGGLPMIRLATPHLESRIGYARLTYPIVGGLLVRTALDVPGPFGFGSFSFEVMAAGGSTTFAVRVDDFAARLLGHNASFPGRLLYLGTESLVHRVLVARFLRGFIRLLRP